MALAAFVAFAVIGQILNVLFCLAIDQIVSPMAGALTFVALYMLVFAAAYKLALFFFDDEAKVEARPQLQARSARNEPARSFPIG
jgi:hypothetical protein